MLTAAAAASEELQQLERTRTTLETTVDDVMRRHPELVADLDERLANEDWDTIQANAVKVIGNVKAAMA